MELLAAVLFLIFVALWRGLLVWPGNGFGKKLAGKKRILFWAVFAVSFVVWIFFLRMVRHLE